MKIIAILSDHIDEELDDAEEYAKLAMETKLNHPEAAELFYKLSGEEMDHMRRLHDCATKMIETYRREKGAPPAEMMAIYEHEHKKQIHKAALVRALQEQYK